VAVLSAKKQNVEPMTSDDTLYCLIDEPSGR
jgi:hypothetical protein